MKKVPRTLQKLSEQKIFFIPYRSFSIDLFSKRVVGRGGSDPSAAGRQRHPTSEASGWWSKCPWGTGGASKKGDPRDEQGESWGRGGAGHKAQRYKQSAYREAHRPSADEVAVVEKRKDRTRKRSRTVFRVPQQDKPHHTIKIFYSHRPERN